MKVLTMNHLPQEEIKLVIIIIIIIIIIILLLLYYYYYYYYIIIIIIIIIIVIVIIDILSFCSPWLLHLRAPVHAQVTAYSEWVIEANTMDH